MSKVYVEGIYAEDLFLWFYEHVISSSGDGAACIVCENYKEVSDWFIQWFCKYKNVQENGDIIIPHPIEKNKTHTIHLGDKKFWHPKHEYKNTINYHDSNENFMFSNDKDIKLFDGDYIFIVKENCKFGYGSDREIRKVI